jgi:beta-xylosidase
MFYFGFNGKTAQEGIAVSRDLRNWEKFPAPVLAAGAGGDIDATHAHKPGILYHDGALYHFYTACRPYKEGDAANNGGEFRCISLARSTPWP